MSIPLVQINDLKMHFKPSGLSLFKKNQDASDGIEILQGKKQLHKWLDNIFLNC